MDNGWVLIGALVAFLAGVFGLSVLLANWHGSYVCSQHGRISGQQTQWVFLDTCYVRHNGEMIRYSAYEQMIVARDGLSTPEPTHDQ